MPKFDMTGVGGGFEPIDAGLYRAYITGAEDKVVESDAKGNKGKPFTAWEFTINDGPYTNRKQWVNAMHFGGGRFMMKDILISSGVFTEDEVDGAEFEFEYEDVIGSEVVIKVVKRLYDGDYRNDVKKVYSADKETTTESSGDRMPL